MSVWKAFTLYGNATGLPVEGKSLRLVDYAGLLSDVDMTHIGEGVYRAQVDEGIWKVIDVTAFPTTTDTGYRLDALSSLVREPAIATSTSNKFWDGTKTFRAIAMTDVTGLEAEFTSSGEDLAAENVARTNADAALDSRLDTIESDFAATLWTQPGGVVAGMRPQVGDNVAAYAEVPQGMVLLQKLYQGEGYRLVGVVEMPASGSFAAGLDIHIKLPNATGLPAIGSYAPYHGSWSSWTIPGGGYQNEVGGVEVVSATATEIILGISSLLWSENFVGREIRFSVDIVGT